MRMQVSGILLAAGVLGVGSVQGQGKGADFCGQIRTLTNDPSVAAAHWGVSVTSLDGVLLCGINQAQLFRPASNNKLFTTAAALTLLGAERQFMTSVFGEGVLTDGVLHGNLRLVGGGDANFGAADLPYVAPAARPKPSGPPPPALPTIADIEVMADQIVAKGVRTIEGDVVGDDQRFAWEPYPFGWEVDDLDGYDGAPVSALTIHDNALEIDVAVGGNEQASVTAAPAVAYYAIENDVVVTDSKEGCRARLSYKRTLGSKAVLLSGNVAAGAQACRLDEAIQDPAEYAAMALKQALERRGVQIAGVAVTKHDLHAVPVSGTIREDVEMDRAAKGVIASGAPVGDKVSFPCALKPVAGQAQTTLATHTSARLGDDVTFTLKESQNLHAEVMLRNIGAALGCAETLGSSAAAVRAFLTGIGIERKDLVLYDGSGLSGHDLTTPRALTQMLVYAAKQTWSETYKAALPVGGVDGTLANRFLPPGSGLKGRVFAKTGTLGESRALSGYVVGASGKTVVFSVMVDNHLPSGGADRVAMDKVVEVIAAGN